MAEEWRRIQGCEGWFEVSDQGRVRKIILLNRQMKRGRLTVCIETCNRVLANLVMEVFGNPRFISSDMAQPINGNQRDCSLDNLVWKRAQRRKRSAPLSENEIERVRNLATTRSETSLSKELGVSRSTIHRAIHGPPWENKRD